LVNTSTFGVAALFELQLVKMSTKKHANAIHRKDC
jgi:hypothetical protein